MTRRQCLRFISFVAAFAALAAAARAEPPAAAKVTPDLIAAAKKEGNVVFYTGMDIQVATLLGKAFEAKYGIPTQVERNPSERVYQRVMMEYDSNIHVVDVLDSADQVHLVDWKRRGMLVPYVPEDLVKWPEGRRDPEGYYAYNRVTLSVFGVNTSLVKPEDAPKSFADMLDPKWKGKIIKAHPAYAGYIMTATFILSRMLGWDYYQKLGQQKVLTVQSSNDPPKKLGLGERPVMFDGNEYTSFIEIGKGAPIKLVYPAEGTPFVGGSSGVAKDAPHPNAARLFISFLYSREAQQLLVDKGGLRSVHPETKDPAGRVPLAAIKQLTADPAELKKAMGEIKRKYAEYFGT
jgi:iron(III) transport system substrate-binding protein